MKATGHTQGLDSQEVQVDIPDVDVCKAIGRVASKLDNVELAIDTLSQKVFLNYETEDWLRFVGMKKTPRVKELAESKVFKDFCTKLRNTLNEQLDNIVPSSTEKF